MIGDVIIIKKSDIVRGKLLIPHLCKLPDKSVISIGGSAGVKKSELAKILQELLYKKNKHTILISLDDLYITHFKSRNRIRKQKGIKSVGLKEIDWKQLRKIIKCFKKGIDTLSLPVINKYTGDYNVETFYGVKEVNFLIVEGLFANYLKKFGNSDYAIHLQGNPDQTLKFRKKRNKENENSEFRKLVVQKEFNVTCQLKRYADKIIEI